MPSSSESLELLALRYIGGELSRSEAEAFESRMAEDQSAREAVARMVDLTAAVRSVEESGAGSENKVAAARTAAHNAWLRPAGWLTLAAAACCAAVVAYQAILSGSADQASVGKSPASAASNQDDEALLWAMLREDPELQPLVRLDVPQQDGWEVAERDEGQGLDDSETSFTSASQWEPPDWMLVGISGLKHDMNEGWDESDQPEPRDL